MTDWSAARHELRKGRLAAWQAYDRLLASERTAIRKAKAHVRQRERFDNMRQQYDATELLTVAAQLSDARQGIEQQMETHAAFADGALARPVAAIVGAETEPTGARKAGSKKQARDWRYSAQNRPRAAIC